MSNEVLDDVQAIVRAWDSMSWRQRRQLQGDHPELGRAVERLASSASYLSGGFPRLRSLLGV